MLADHFTLATLVLAFMMQPVCSLPQRNAREYLHHVTICCWWSVQIYTDAQGSFFETSIYPETSLEPTLYKARRTDDVFWENSFI